jgi:anti-sigma factor RsiW
MDHEEVKEKLFLFYDQELSEQERGDIETHLAQCAECGKSYQQWRNISSALFTIEQPRGQRMEDFVARVMERLTRVADPAMSWQHTLAQAWRIMAVGFGCAAALFLVVLNSDQSVVTTETILLADGRGAVQDQWVLTSKEPLQDELMGFALEE